MSTHSIKINVGNIFAVNKLNSVQDGIQIDFFVQNLRDQKDKKNILV